MPDTLKRARWKARRDKGLCGECGVVPSAVLSRCTLCRQFINEWRKKWWRRGAGRRLNRLKREAYARNPEPFKQDALSFRRENRDAENARHRAYYRAHRDEMRAKARARYLRLKALKKSA
jgi:hypothetical protein